MSWMTRCDDINSSVGNLSEAKSFGYIILAGCAVKKIHRTASDPHVLAGIAKSFSAKESSIYI